MVAKAVRFRGSVQIQMLLLGGVCAVATAGPIDVSSLHYVTLGHGARLTVEFSVGNYGRNNPTASPYPASLDFELLGPDLGAGEMARIPGASASYFTGYGLSGQLESMDGSTYLPLVDANATRLGLGAGSLLVGRGTWLDGGTDNSVALISATRVLSLSQSQAIFGADESAYILLTNTGADLTIELGSGYNVRNAVSEPGVRGLGGFKRLALSGASPLRKRRSREPGC